MAAERINDLEEDLTDWREIQERANQGTVKTEEKLHDALADAIGWPKDHIARGYAGQVFHYAADNNCNPAWLGENVGRTINDVLHADNEGVASEPEANASPEHWYRYGIFLICYMDNPFVDRGTNINAAAAAFRKAEEADRLIEAEAMQLKYDERASSFDGFLKGFVRQLREIRAGHLDALEAADA